MSLSRSDVRCGRLGGGGQHNTAISKTLLNLIDPACHQMMPLFAWKAGGGGGRDDLAAAAYHHRLGALAAAGT